ncbi:MAG: GNAT family N-acetyltransferase [Candidatus Thorarchaeota archaeon]|nr:MAG: GNAT family N-acetyltransferase [Candidatus Thorarchaeota archaeon]
MTIDIEILKPEQIDIPELVEFTMVAQKQLDEQLRCGQTEEEVEKYIRGAFKVDIFHYIFARHQGKLVGMSGCYTYTASMVYLDGWNPLVLPGEDYEEIFKLIVSESIKYTKSIGRNRLEIFLMELTDDIRTTYDRVRPLYESAGMRRGNEWSHMVCDLTSSTLKEPEVPEGFTLKPLIEVDNEEIWPSYNATFLASGDQRYLDQTEEQRRENFDDFFDRSKPLEEEASLLLYSGDLIVGFMKINLYSIGGFVNGVGTHPDFRRRGLARLLMTSSIVRAAQNGMKELVLEVDITNRQAIALYEQLGFKKTKGSISHVWTE